MGLVCGTKTEGWLKYWEVQCIQSRSLVNHTANTYRQTHQHSHSHPPMTIYSVSSSPCVMSREFWLNLSTWRKSCWHNVHTERPRVMFHIGLNLEGRVHATSCSSKLPLKLISLSAAMERWADVDHICLISRFLPAWKACMRLDCQAKLPISRHYIQ